MREQQLMKINEERRKVLKEQKILKAVFLSGLDEKAIRWCKSRECKPDELEIIRYKNNRSLNISVKTFLDVFEKINKNPEVFSTI
jgi:hypothetical protein